MAAERIVVGLDVGTTKICALVARVSESRQIEVLGVGLEESRGISKGTVVDVALATEAIADVKRQAERISGYEIGRTFVSVAGKHINSLNSRGVTGLNPNRGVVGSIDIERALESARAVALPHNREVIHVIPRSFTLDDQSGIRNPMGLHAYRLEVEAHIITASSASLRNLEKAVNDAGLRIDRFVLNPIASGEEVLTEAERESGVVVIDIGGGTTDVAVLIEGTVWHTAVIEVGGNHITNDIAQVLHLPADEAERIKLEHGSAFPDSVAPDLLITVEPFGREKPTQVLAYDVARIIEARADEIFTLVTQELKRSGYDALLPAGVVLTGGTAKLRHIRESATRVMRLPARIGQPEDFTGLIDKIQSPAFATSVGLLRFASSIEESTIQAPRERRAERNRPEVGKIITDFFDRLLPRDEEE